MIPSFYPTENWVMRIFPYLINYDATTNERIKFIFQYCLSMETYKQQFFTNAFVRILKINKIKKFPFILKLRKNLSLQSICKTCCYLFLSNIYHNSLSNSPKILITEPCERNPSSRSESTYTSFKFLHSSLILNHQHVTQSHHVIRISK